MCGECENLRKLYWKYLIKIKYIPITIIFCFCIKTRSSAHKISQPRAPTCSPALRPEPLHTKLECAWPSPWTLWPSLAASSPTLSPPSHVGWPHLLQAPPHFHPVSCKTRQQVVGGKGLVRRVLQAFTPALPIMGWSCLLWVSPSFCPITETMPCHTSAGSLLWWVIMCKCSDR